MSETKATPPAWRYMLSDVLFDQAEEQAVVDVIRSKWLSMGPRTNDLEQRFAAHVGAGFALATSNCTTALHLAVLAVGLAPGDEVIVPSLSFVATANAVLYAGAQPVFADVCGLDRPMLSVEEVRRKITPKTRAVIPMHYAGYPCDMGPLLLLAKDHGLAVIEDAAHAVGSKQDGKGCGTIGDIGAFSFFANKNLPAGEGGMVTTNDPALFEAMKLRRSHGMTTLSWDRFKGHSFSYDVVDVGYNFRMPELTAAVALVQLGKLDGHNAQRDRVFAAYCASLQGHPKLVVPFANEEPPGARHIMPIVLREDVDRAAFMQAMKDRGIQTSIHYPPIHEFSHYRKLCGQVDLPITQAYSRREVTLPFHPGLSNDDVKTICDAVSVALGAAG
jgi:dTDP-4-amino-4,6-dideoxygalactose transaminase